MRESQKKKICKDFIQENEKEIKESKAKILLIMEDLFDVYLDSAAVEDLNEEDAAEIWSELWYSITHDIVPDEECQ